MWGNEQRDFWLNGQGWARFWCNIGGFCDPNKTDALGWTPLHHAIDSMSFSERAFFAAMELVPLMSKEYLAKTTQAPSQHMPVPVGYTALHFACSGSTVGFHNGKIIKAFINANADVDWKDHGGNTPLHLACGSGIQDAVEVLVDNGADVKRLNKNQKGMIELAQASPSLQN